MEMARLCPSCGISSPFQELEKASVADPDGQTLYSFEACRTCGHCVMVKRVYRTPPEAQQDGEDPFGPDPVLVETNAYGPRQPRAVRAVPPHTQREYARANALARQRDMAEYAAVACRRLLEKLTPRTSAGACRQRAPKRRHAGMRRQDSKHRQRGCARRR